MCTEFEREQYMFGRGISQDHHDETSPQHQDEREGADQAGRAGRECVCVCVCVLLGRSRLHVDR